MMKYLLATLLLACSMQVFSEDIELYVNNTASTTQRPNVLIILDNSGSMGNVNNTSTKAYKARKIIIDLINDNPSVDFALQIFNYNYSGTTNRNGGRIISGFKDLSDPVNKKALLDLLDSDTDNTNTNYKVLKQQQTPLCETLYETYRYLSGGAVYYGIQNVSNPPSIISSGSYTSPFSNIVCNKEVTIIYITDGSPTHDTDANSKISTLTGATSTSNYLGVLGEWMGRKDWRTYRDINNILIDEVVATVKIHTVGFGSITSNNSAVTLLKSAARDGVVESRPEDKPGYHTIPAGGKYHEASDADALKLALGAILIEVVDTSTLTSASVSANSFDRTQTLDSVYYGMFEPSTAARWQGNLKKYKIVNGAQVDALNHAAIDASGEFNVTSQSFWSKTVDGNEVAEGGVAEMLRTTKTVDRKLFTDITGADKFLTEFSQSKIAAVYDTPEKLVEQFKIPIGEVTDIPNHIKWAMGVDVDDEDIISDVRPDVFGDPLHSKPIVVNYATGGTRIVVGTNAGVLHMFEDVSDTEVKESWAYLPKEFFKNIKPLRQNAVAVNNKIYGLDGLISLYINDLNSNGMVDPGDSAWLFFGLRRGGSSYYALDITKPDQPKLMWHIENPPGSTGDFEELGLTFSKPQVVKSALNTTDPDKLVVIFGGGYDIKKDEVGPNTHNDGNGAAVYMVNARTGDRIFKKATGSNNGIASSVASLDSDSDGLVDRLYVGDTGGNVWRVDMPDASYSHTSIIKLASLGGITNLDDRRFFNQPAIVRTYILETTDVGTVGSPNIVKHEVPYDAILLGSGDKATPTDINTNDMFFMIKDKYIKTQQFGSSIGTTPLPATITLSTLYDYTLDPFKNYPVLTAAQEANLITASLQSGWHFDLKQLGEKNSAQAIVINNVVYFTSYTPSPKATCSVNPGDAWLYAVDLALGIKKYNWSIETDNREDRIKHIGNQFLGAPTLISTPVTDAVTGETKTQGNLIVGKEVLQVGFTLQTMRTSLTIPEN